MSKTMTKQLLKKKIDVAAGRIPADLVIKNANIVNVYTHSIEKGDIAVSDGLIVGIGEYEGIENFDAKGNYLLPGFLDSHIHIESSYVTPEEFGRLTVPHGTTTIIADPHEIVNVCGLTGLDYMMDSSQKTVLDIKYMLSSCVPATVFEHSGANLTAKDMKEAIGKEQIIGLGEFMDFPGVVNADSDVLDKLLLARQEGKLIDGHSPGLSGLELNAYISAGIRNDHECDSVESMQERLARGMYVMLRQGSCCKDLRTLAKGVTPENARRCILCSDDRQPKSIFSEGHMEEHLKICVEEGIDAITAIQMATLNVAESFRLYDRGAIAPGLRADLVLVKDLNEFEVTDVWIQGKKVAERDHMYDDAKVIYLPEFEKTPITPVRGSFHVKDFQEEKLKLNSRSKKINAISVLEDGVVTKKETVEIELTKDGNFIFDPDKDLAKIAVIERHQNTGNVAVGILKGYGIKYGAIALSIAHDSHNIIVVGVDDKSMEMAVNELIAQEGGMVLVKDGKVISSIPMPIGGIMSDQTGEWVEEELSLFHKKAHEELKISRELEPAMTLCFMSLPVIPEIKITDMGLFDVKRFEFISIEADE